MKIAVVGGGWYGCHITSILMDLGIEVKLFEKSNDLFLHASTNNQNRLHLGFHYPRSKSTRDQSKEGFKRFLEKYPDLAETFDNNIYAVDNDNSLLDFGTYKQIISSTNLEYKEVKNPLNKFSNLDGFIITNEMLINPRKSKMYFKNRLKNVIELNTELTLDSIIESKSSITVNGTKFDYLINCTWGAFEPLEHIPLFYESCLTLVYKSSLKKFSLTIMDGEFVSLYPISDGLFSLTSVKNTPMYKSNSFSKVSSYLKSCSEEEISKKRKLFEDEINYYYPKFKSEFSYSSYYTSIKTKLDVKNDARHVFVELKGRKIMVLPGKIDTIFKAEDIILEKLGLKQ